MAKTCNRCKMENLEWDSVHHENTGKWILINSEGIPHRCTFKKRFQRLILKWHLIHCGMCPTGCGWCTKDQLERHNNIYHPNGEIVETQHFG